MLKVLIVVTNADLAGAPIHVRDLALSLHQSGKSVFVVFGENGLIRSQLEDAGIATDCIPTLRSNINIFQDWLSFVSLSAVVKRIKPDLLHLHSSKAGLVGRLVGLRLGIPVIYTVHGWGFGPGRKRIVALFVRLTEWICKSLTSRYIAVSKADRLMGVKELGIDRSRIVTIYNGTSFQIEQSVKNNDRLILIMVARNDRQKDYNTFLKALAKAQFDEALLVGKGTNIQSFIEQARLIIGANFNKVKFLGATSNVEELLTYANVMVLSSRFEGLPISIIEGMSKGLPILASNVGGIPELVKHGINGFLFDTGDEVSLASHINYLYSHSDERRKIGKASLERFKRDFDLGVMVNKTVGQYELALKKIRTES